MRKKPRAAGAWSRNRKTVFAGAVVGVLALIGLVSVIIWTVNMTGKIIDNTAQKEELEKFITPVVIFDPVPFDNIADADKTFLLQSSMWGTLLSDRSGNYSYDDLGMALVPSTDLDAAAVRLYGESVKLTHQNFDDNEISYLYDDELKAYHVPVTAKIAYSPKVEKIAKVGDILSVRVGYVPPDNIWAMDKKAKTYSPSPEKYMIYELKKVKDGYNIVAIKDTDDSAPRS